MSLPTNQANKQGRQFFAATVIVLIVSFIGSSLYIPQAYANDLNLPSMPTPGMMVHLSRKFTPAYLQGLTIHPDNALQFDFLINRGDNLLSNEQKKEEYKKLVKYFLASLTIPDDDQWVNLSPYEKDRIIKDDFGKTEMGRDLLAQDYMLKQITASLIYPEDNLGKKFWERVYERAYKEYGATNIPINTFNKVWIIPDQAAVYESGNTVYVLRNHLKVMLEEDYLSLDKHTAVRHADTRNINKVGSQIVREIILPELEKEVNTDKNFAILRQVYSGMILATWYKHALKESLLGKVYANQAKVRGVDQNPLNNQIIYQQYLKAFKKGVFNYIREDKDPYPFSPKLGDQPIARKYFSGGMRDFASITQGGPSSVFVPGTVLVFSDKAAISPRVQEKIDFDFSQGQIDRATIALNPNTHQPFDAAMVGDSIKVLRESLGFSIEQLAQRIGVHTSVIESVENGMVFPSDQLIESIGAGLGLSSVQVAYLKEMAKERKEKITTQKPLEPARSKGVVVKRTMILQQDENTGGHAEISSGETDTRQFAKMIKDGREAEGLTQAELAQKIGRATAYISQIETPNGDKYPSSETAYQLGKELGWSEERIATAQRQLESEKIRLRLKRLQRKSMLRKDQEVSGPEIVLDPNVSLERVTRQYGEMLQKGREAAKLSPEELAERLGVSSAYIYQIESPNGDKLPSSEFIDRTGRVLRWNKEYTARIRELLEAEKTGVKLKRLEIRIKHLAEVSSQRKEDDDEAMSSPGGIDMNSANLAMMIIKRDGKGVPLPLSQQDMAQLNHIQGFDPEILKIIPVVYLPVINKLQQKLRSY